MTMIPTQAQNLGSARGPTASVFRPAWLLARETLLARGTLALLGGALVLDLLERSWLPIGIATSQTRGGEVGSELRLLLFGALTLLLLLRAARWGALLRGLDPMSRVCIVLLSGLYLHMLCVLVVAMPEALLFGRHLATDWNLVGASIWLTSLAGILALSRLGPRTLGLAFLLLAWWVPVLGMPGPVCADAVARGISHPPWSADGILPMLVPQLLALGYVSLERVQR
jgi:hypothetical protein